MFVDWTHEMDGLGGCRRSWISKSPCLSPPPSSPGAGRSRKLGPFFLLWVGSIVFQSRTFFTLGHDCALISRHTPALDKKSTSGAGRYFSDSIIPAIAHLGGQGSLKPGMPNR